MRWIPGGVFFMGSDDGHVEEVSGFWMDAHPVTIAEFSAFVESTGYVTSAERSDDAPSAPGSMVFQPTNHPVDLDASPTWWRFMPGASWRSPLGHSSSTLGLENDPVVHVAYEDAAAYCAWTGKDLPTEAEWERAARGGLSAKPYEWGDDFTPRGRVRANTWHGEFPWQKMAPDGYFWTSPVQTYPPNGFGLYDMTGNVWEWTRDLFTFPNSQPPAVSPQGWALADVEVPQLRPGKATSRESATYLVIKGGSYLCAPNYCDHCRPAARQAQPADMPACHIGFRCVARPARG
jgi:formylglycine-generating enzyme required for sulfatase activity